MQDGNVEALEAITEARVTAAGADTPPRSRPRTPRRRGRGRDERRRTRGHRRRGGRRGRSGRRRLPGPVPDRRRSTAPTIHRERAAGRRVALTYDDGPNPEQTPRLLDLLDRHDAKATFFLIGKWAEREPELIREIVAARGHAIGNHTYTHPTMPAHGAKRIREELRRCREAVEASGETVLHRRRRRADAPTVRAPPAGHAADDARGGLRPGDLVDHRVRLARAHHHEGDHAPRASARKEGDIILLHDGVDTRSRRRIGSRSIECTAGHPRAPRLRRDISFVTVPELVAAARLT